MASLAALILAPGFLSRQAVCMISYSGFPASASQVKNVWWSWAERFMS